jgi:bacterioferritin
MAQVQISDELKGMMNEAIARELQVSIQYMWQHVVWRGVKGFTVKGELRSISIAEMKHAETIAERLFYFGVAPTTKPDPIIVDEGLREQLERDLKDEEGALELYRRIIEKANEDGDIATAQIFRGILVEEEDPHDTFQSLLEEL